MSLPRPPGLEPRRFANFEAELLARARSWIPAWSLNESESDFGRALLAIAARFSAETAERLDRVGDKMARGFLDWLAIRGDAARPARMPAAFKLADTMKASVLAPRRTRMQADALGTSVSFETESDLLIVPGGIALLIAVDPAEDAIYLPPPGLTSLALAEPAPVQWRLKGFAAAGTTTLQLDPGAGLAEGMLIEIEGAQYEIKSAKDDLVTIDPPVPEGGFDEGTPVDKLTAFRPFDGARNRQNHVLYIGDDDLLNIQSEATIDVVGAESLPEEIAWEYWGKESQDDDPAWLTLNRAEDKQQKIDALVLVKPKGSVEKTAIGPSESRWIRASTAHIAGSEPLLDSDGIALRINATPADPAALSAADPKDLPALTVFVNSTSSAATQFYPLGREPRLFDTLYLGSSEAFSKAGAAATVHFDLAVSLFAALAGLEVGAIGKVLAAIDTGGALNLFVLDANGNPVSLADRGPLVPQGADDTLALLSPFKPAMWSDGMNLFAATASGNQVWTWWEARPFPYYSQWVSWGALPPDPDNQVEALVPVMAASMTLVALRNGKLFVANPVSGSVTWSAMSFPSAGSTVKAIAPVAPEVPGVVQDSFLAIVETAGIATLHSVNANGVATQLVSNVATDVRPFGIKRYLGNIVEAVAVSDDHKKMIAHRGTTTVTANLEANTTFIDAAIDGRIENALTVAYCLAATASGAPVLLAWSPFDPALSPVVFQDLADLSAGTPSAAIAVLSNRAFTPGSNEGEIIAATLGGARRSYPTTAATFTSSIAFAKPAPALAAGDMIAAGLNLDIAKVENTPAKDGLGDFNGLTFLWLDQWLDVDTVPAVVQLFDMTAPATSAKVLGNHSKLKVAPGAAPAVGSFVLVDVSPGAFIAAQVTAVSAMGLVVTLSKSLNPIVTGTIVNFRVSSSATAQIFPALALNSTNDNFDLALVSPGDLYFPVLDPAQQEAIAVQDDGQAPPHAKRIALAVKWSATPAAATSFVIDSAVTGWALVRSDTATNPALSWEYWNGTGWWRLDRTDGTHNLRNSGDVSFVVPSDLKPVDWSGKTDSWVRVRLIGGDYGTEKIVAVTKTTSNGTEQTIERSHDGIRPPFALTATVSYRTDEKVPDRLLTSDSLTLRDQSDANRTPGAMIEGFVPLIVTLSRLTQGPAVATGENCAPDCDCATASTSPAVPSAPPHAAATEVVPGRALYMGVEAELEGAPINLFFETEKEGSYDTLAPLAAHALDGNRLVRLAAADATRAMSETGIVSLVVSTAPARAQLFGATLVWLRLAPRAGAAVWEPKLAGAYLNAVWTHAAETMTRERLGSSVGAPDLTVHLARPPLLHDTLELRIREPLGMDESDAFTADDPTLVKSDVENLPGDWVLWRQVDDPHDWGATDRVYALDEDTGTIRFGNGLHGMIPPAGADCIVAFEYERTEPATPQGVPGNFITARATLNLATPLLNVESVIAIERSAGGVPPEPAERVLKFGAAKLRHRGRAVSAKDFEDLALEQSADVVQARCFVRNGKIRLVVVMRGADPVPDRAQIRELGTMLAERAPSQALQALSVEGPRVRRLRIYLTLRVATLDVAGQVDRDVKAALIAYFDTEQGGSAGEGWPLGASPCETDIAEALLSVASLEGIASVARMEVDENGTETSWPDAIRASDLAMASADGVRIDFQIAEAAA